MKVKAIGIGQYKNRIIERGQVFDIETDKEFSRRWMEKVAEPASVAAPEPSERRHDPEERKAIDEQLQAEDMGVVK